MPQYDESRGYETKDLSGSFHSHFTELWLEQTVLIWMVCPTNGLQSFITQGMPVDLVPRGFAQVSTNGFLLKSMENINIWRHGGCRIISVFEETCRRYEFLVTPDPLTYLQLIAGDPTKLVMYYCSVTFFKSKTIHCRAKDLWEVIRMCRHIWRFVLKTHKNQTCIFTDIPNFVWNFACLPVPHKKVGPPESASHPSTDL